MMTRRRCLALVLQPISPPDPRAALEEVMGPLHVLSGVPRVESGQPIREGEVIRTRIGFEAEPGDMVPAWLLAPASARPAGAVLCLHQTTRIGKDEPAGLGGSPNLHYARELALRGWVTLAPDYPNFGDYRCDVYTRGYASATMKGIVNHMRAVSWLLRYGKVAVCGHSLGGHNSLFLAAFDSRVSAVITSCGFTSFAKYYGGNLKGWSHRGYMPRIESVYGCDPARMPFDFPDVLRLIAPRPLFINAPLHDANFDASGVDDCVAAVRSAYSESGRLRLEHPDCGHDFPPETRTLAWGFLDKHIRG